MNVLDNRLFFYFLHLKIIGQQLWQIDNELKSKMQKRFVKNRFKWIRSNFMLVHGMTQHVNNIFGCSHMILILLSLQCAVVFLNSFYRLFNGKFKTLDSDLMVASGAFMVCRAIVHLFYFNKETTACYGAVK